MDRRDFIEGCKNFIATVKKARDDVQANIQAKNEVLERQLIAYRSMEEAKQIISNEISSIQLRLKEGIDNLVTIALKIVYCDRDISFNFQFDKSSSGQSQYKPVIVENGEEFDPKSEQCGGALDVISYALRIILHSVEVPKGRDFMLFDEPFKFLGGGPDGQRAADMKKKIDNDLEIQSIVLSHDEIILSRAEKVYFVKHDGRKSDVALRINRSDEERQPAPPTKNEVKRVTAAR